jgi:hypothetical protein
LRRTEVSGPVHRTALPCLGPRARRCRASGQENGRPPARSRSVRAMSISLATSFMEDQVPRGHYYDANWTYRLSYSLSGQIHLLVEIPEQWRTGALGLGWDRWFVFLHKGGVSERRSPCSPSPSSPGWQSAWAGSQAASVPPPDVQLFSRHGGQNLLAIGHPYFWGLSRGAAHARNAIQEYGSGS